MIDEGLAFRLAVCASFQIALGYEGREPISHDTQYYLRPPPARAGLRRTLSLSQPRCETELDELRVLLAGQTGAVASRRERKSLKSR